MTEAPPRKGKVRDRVALFLQRPVVGCLGEGELEEAREGAIADARRGEGVGAQLEGHPPAVSRGEF
jgi:hypothetical protein